TGRSSLRTPSSRSRVAVCACPVNAAHGAKSGSDRATTSPYAVSLTGGNTEARLVSRLRTRPGGQAGLPYGPARSAETEDNETTGGKGRDRHRGWLPCGRNR